MSIESLTDAGSGQPGAAGRRAGGGGLSPP